MWRTQIHLIGHFSDPPSGLIVLPSLVYPRGHHRLRPKSGHFRSRKVGVRGVRHENLFDSRWPEVMVDGVPRMMEGGR